MKKHFMGSMQQKSPIHPTMHQTPPRCSYVIQSGLCLLLNMRRARGGRAQDASRKRRRITRDSRSQSPAEERKKSAAFTPGRRHTRGGVVQQLAGLARTKRSAAGASVDSIRLRARARSGRIGFRSRCGTYRIFLRRPRSRRRCCRVQSWCCLVRVSLAARHPPPQLCSVRSWLNPERTGVRICIKSGGHAHPALWTPPTDSRAAGW